MKRLIWGEECELDDDDHFMEDDDGLLLDQLRKEYQPQPEDTLEGTNLFNEEGSCAEFDERSHLEVPDSCLVDVPLELVARNIWREPCIVFTPHWSLRLGPVVHFLQRWHNDVKSLLVLEKELDADLALAPFQPLAMKVLQCSFLSGIRSSKIAPLLETLQPKCVLFPEDLKTTVSIPKAPSFPIIYYSENYLLRVPSLKQCAELEIATDLASRFQWINLKEGDINITRLKGKLTMEGGKHWLCMSPESKEGSIDLETLSTVLQKMGFSTSVQEATSDGSSTTFVLNVDEPSKALIEVKPTRIVISTSDKLLSSRIFEAVDGILSGGM